MVRKVLTGMFLLAALGIYKANAQLQVYVGSAPYTVRNGYYNDDYHYETRQRRVWIPAHRISGIFGIGTRIIPGHYEIRTERIRVYDRYSRSREGKRPHGMPPGQRKKTDYHKDRDHHYNDIKYPKHGRKEHH